jgi:hypothetical protein
LLKIKIHCINKRWSVQSGDCAVYCGKNVMTFWRNKVRPLRWGWKRHDPAECMLVYLLPPDHTENTEPLQ